MKYFVVVLSASGNIADASGKQFPIYTTAASLTTTTTTTYVHVADDVF